MDTIAKFTIPGIAFLLTLAFGLWVSYSGKPYNGILFNIHKLLALGVVIITIVQLAGILRNVDAGALNIILLVLAALCIVALFSSGALMSMNKLDYMLILTIHRVASPLMVFALALVIYLLVSKL